MRSIPRAASLTAAALLCAACSSELAAPIGRRDDSPPARGGTITVASFVGLRSLDPAVAFDEGADPIQRLLFARLVRLSRDGRFEGELAESFETSADGRHLRFRLRSGARFHDGAPVTAADVKRSLERSLHKSTPCPAPSFYDRIEGFEPFHSGAAHELTGIRIESDSVVRFDLSHPDATFLAVLTLPMAAPVCASGGSSYEPSFSSRPCGAGPFKLRQWDDHEGLTLDRHDGYAEPGRVWLDSVRWLLEVPLSTQRFRFERGDLDLLHDLSVADGAAFRRDPRWRGLGEWTVPRMTKGLFMNSRMAPFDRLEVRRAVAAAIDRDSLARLRGGCVVPADRVIPPGVLGHDPDFPGQRFDPALALDSMRRAGLPFDPATGLGGWPDTIDYVAPADSFDLQFAEVAQQQLARIGIRLRLKAMAWPAYLARISRAGQARIGAAGWTADFDDPGDFFEPLFASKSIQDEDSQNYAFYSNPELDALLERGRAELDPVRRKAIYRRAEEIIRDEAPWALAYGYRRYEVWQGYVRGYRPHPHAQLDVGFLWLDRRDSRGSARSPARNGNVLASLLPRRGAP